MEMWILVALFVIGAGFSLFGFLRKSFAPVAIGALVLISASAILYTDGYDSYVKCGADGNCAEITTFTYDANSNLVRTDMNVFKVNASSSKLSANFSLGALFGAVIMLMVALMAYMGSR
jgi:disulfide bond formation protein DsbB